MVPEEARYSIFEIYYEVSDHSPYHIALVAADSEERAKSIIGLEEAVKIRDTSYRTQKEGVIGQFILPG